MLICLHRKGYLQIFGVKTFRIQKMEFIEEDSEMLHSPLHIDDPQEVPTPKAIYILVLLLISLIFSSMKFKYNHIIFILSSIIYNFIN